MDFGSKTPMSERQQLALLKKMEIDKAAAAKKSTDSPSTSDAYLVSPPRTPLQAVNGHHANSSNSLRRSETPSPASYFGSTPKSAAGSGSPQTSAVDRLLRKVRKKNEKGETPLHRAAYRGSRELTEALLRLGADPNVQDHAEWTPLHEACNRGNYPVAKLLFENGADLNVRGYNRDSPLHDAARNGHLKVVRFLVKNGADLKARNVVGHTAAEEVEQAIENCKKTSLELQLRKTLEFLKDLNEVGSESAEEESAAEEEKEDIARFLGLPRSPAIVKAFKKAGVRLPVVKPKVRLDFDATMEQENKEQPLPQPPSLPEVKPETQESTAAPVKKSAEEDVYEFKSKEPTTPDLTQNSQGLEVKKEAGEAEKGGESIPVPVGEKRSATAEDEDEELKKRKKRAEETGKESPVPKARSTRGSSSEKSKKSSSSSSSDKDRKSPLSGRNSPESTEDADQKKVPPLKIVLSASPPEGKEKPEKSDEKKEVVVKAEEDNKVEAEAASSLNNRVTRSRANQGTPVPPSDEANSSSQDSAHEPVQGGHSGSQEGPKQAPTSFEYNVKKRRLRNQAGDDSASQQVVSGAPAVGGQGQSASGGQNGQASNEPVNDIEKFLNIRKQVAGRRKDLFPVQPKPPEGFNDYLMNRKTYLLQHNASERLRTLPMIQPPHSLEGPLRNLFKEQEQERYKLRMKHVVEKEKLVLAVEQEILRVHGRAARALANQSLPFSVCTILRDEEIYTPIDPELEEKNRDIRSRYNGRLFLSWLQDVDDKWEKIKEQMVLRHHNEAESLNAVQKMDWEWKVNELSVGNHQQQSPLPTPQRRQMPPMAQIDDLHIPMVHVSDDFDLADCRQ